MTKLYLAYGSNLSIEQMAFRCPGARVVGTAAIEGYRLMYKGSKTGAYATIEPAKGYRVPVLVWEITERDEDRLDIYEGYSKRGYSFYNKKDLQVDITSLDGNHLGEHTAMVYIMDENREHGIPQRGYELILHEGYERFKFNKLILQEAMNYTRQQVNRKRAVR